MDPSHLQSELRSTLLSYHNESHVSEQPMDFLSPKYEHSVCLKFPIRERHAYHEKQYGIENLNKLALNLMALCKRNFCNLVTILKMLNSC